MYIYIHTYIHAYMFVSVYTYTYIYICLYTRTCKNHLCVCLRAYAWYTWRFGFWSPAALTAFRDVDFGVLGDLQIGIQSLGLTSGMLDDPL